MNKIAEKLGVDMFRWMLGAVCLGMAACQPATVAAERPIRSAEQQNLSSEVFIRIIKTTDAADKGILEMWKRGSDGAFHLDGRFDICTWSGALGPKLREGDGQSPEGFYFIKPSSLNPNSSFHLSFNLGFPNAYDRAHERTGSYLMVHGACSSIGCYAMTNDGIEDVYAGVEAAFAGGQSFIRVHIFPFEMTEANLTRYATNPNHAFWMNLKTGWDWFEKDRVPPNVSVSNLTYRFEASE